jgi:hypothetical protein
MAGNMLRNTPIMEAPVEYVVPSDDRPRWIDWQAGTDDTQAPIELRWWIPANVEYGGRYAQVVIDSKGEMAVFHGRHRAGVHPAPYEPHAPHSEEFWPLVAPDTRESVLDDPATHAHRLRDTGWTVAMVDGELGLAMAVPPDGPESMLWRLAHACTLLGFYPPLGLGFTGERREFEVGMDTLEERAARRVKRALIERLTHDRRQLRELSDKIETNWRT